MCKFWLINSFFLKYIYIPIISAPLQTQRIWWKYFLDFKIPQKIHWHFSKMLFFSPWLSLTVSTLFGVGLVISLEKVILQIWHDKQDKIRDHLQIVFLILNEYNCINLILFLLKSSENVWLPDNIKGIEVN